MTMEPAADKPVSVTAQSFEQEVVQSTIPVVLDFWAPWCGPCRVIGPILDELAAKWAGQVKVVKLNVDEEPALAELFQVRGIPTLVAMRGRDVVDVQVGASGRAKLEQLFVRLTQTEPLAQAS
jgi:thioredoxin 1